MKNVKRFLFLFIAHCLLCVAVAFAQADSSATLKSGIAKFNEGNYDGAEVDLTKAAEASPKNPNAFF